MGYVAGKVAVVTGAGGGFGRLISMRFAEAGGRVLAIDIDEQAVGETARLIRDTGGQAVASPADVTVRDDMRAAVDLAVDRFGRVDVLVNNAGIMPLAFFRDHAIAGEAWDRAIDINIKGTVNGIAAVYDQMTTQGAGHVVNISSIYGNAGVAGGGVYSATKAAIDALSQALRNEAKGTIKVTVVKPTGVPGTNLLSSVLDLEATGPLAGHLIAESQKVADRRRSGALTPQEANEDRIEYAALTATQLVDSVMYAIDQPWGVSISDITVRASGDLFVY